MKKLLTILFFLALCNVSRGTNYYISAAGSDANIGTSAVLPWLTLAKASAATYATGDQILLRAGDTFLGTLLINHSGITVSSYGTGAKPIITALVAIPSWTNEGGGIYSCIIDRAKANLHVVTLDGVPQGIGRFPNFNPTNGGYLTYTAGVGVNKIRGLATTGNTGKKIIIKKNYWREENATVTAQNGDTITFIKTEQMTDGGSSPQEAAGSGRGYFYVDSLAYVDTLFEWHYNFTTKKLSMYFNGGTPSGHVVRVSTRDTGIGYGTFSNININNIHFEGQNMFGVIGQLGNNVSITDCDFNDLVKGIGITATRNVQILRNTFDWCLENAVCVNSNSGSKKNVVIRENVATNTALIDGAFCFYHPEDGSAFSGSAKDTLYIGYNESYTSGADAYLFTGGGPATNSYGAIIEYNVADSCEYWVADHGAAYKYDTINSLYRNTIIRYNFFSNGIGANYGTNTSQHLSSGIYLDGQCSYATIYGNIISGMPRRGIILNEPLNVTMYQNGGYNNNTWLLFSKYGVRGGDPQHRDSIHIVDTANLSYNFTGNTAHVYYLDAWLQGYTVRQALARVGTIDYNMYNQVDALKWKVEAYTTPGVGFSYPTLDLITWQDSSGHDTNSSSVDDYTLGNTKLITNATGSAVSEYLDMDWLIAGTTTRIQRTFVKPAWSWYILIDPQPLSGTPTNIINGIKFIQAP